MKKSLTVLAIIGMSSAAFASDGKFNEKILSELNMICGDTWCEGDLQFNFEKLNCNYEAQSTFGQKKGLCVLEFSFAEQGASSKKTKKGSCTLIGYSSPDSIKGNHTNSYSSGISDGLYEEISDCLSAWEATN